MNYFLIGSGIVGLNVIEHLDGEVILCDPAPIKFNFSNVVCVLQQALNETNYQALLEKHTQPGDVIIDTAIGINTVVLCAWAYKNQRHYVNTVCEMWEHENIEITNGYKDLDTIYSIGMQEALKLVEKNRTGPTSFIGHGANIGMVNHFFKVAVLDKAKALKSTPEAVLKTVKNVYILEKDTLNFRDDFIPSDEEFYNSWCPATVHMESAVKATYPSQGKIVCHDRPQVRDVYIKNHCIHGRVVVHEETFSLDAYLQKQGVQANEIQFIYECSPMA